MRYLFFDIEASDGSYGLCEFGYVITNENFELLCKKTYLINPKKKFKTVGRKHQKDLVLSYPQEDYLKSPLFVDVYDNIKFLLEQKDLVIFGYSVSNDINFLRKACNRYKLPYINFVAYDVQKMFYYFANERKRFASLTSLIEAIVPKNEYETLINHRSMDDAFLSMLGLKSMLSELNFTVNDLINVCEGCELNSKDIISNLNKQEKDRLKSKEAQKMWGNFYRTYLSFLEKEENNGKIITISSKIKDDVFITKKVIKRIEELKLIPFDRINESDFLIVLNENDKDRLLGSFKYPYNGKIITIDTFLNSNINNF